MIATYEVFTSKYLHNKTHTTIVLEKVLISQISQPDQTEERGDKVRNKSD